jgi:hypothetical protein
MRPNWTYRKTDWHTNDRDSQSKVEEVNNAVGTVERAVRLEASCEGCIRNVDAQESQNDEDQKNCSDTVQDLQLALGQIEILPR